MVEFYTPYGYARTLSEGIPGIAGGLILPSLLPQMSVTRRDLADEPYLTKRLLDPQLYLIHLDPSEAKEICVKLGSYPWFPTEKYPAYDSKEHKKQAKWREAARERISGSWVGKLPEEPEKIKAAVRESLAFQQGLGCHATILPVPLTDDVDSDFSKELTWIDTGLGVAKELGAIAYPSIVIQDFALRGRDPMKNSLLDTIIDQITAREPAGVYLAIEMGAEEGYYLRNNNTVGSLLRLVASLKAAGVPFVIVSFATVAGLLAVAEGADAWCSHWFLSQRRLKISDIREKVGIAYPSYYSHPMAAEFHLENDLDSAVKAGFLERVADESPYSSPLIAALRAGKTVSDVPNWQYAKSRHQEARNHFSYVMARETAILGGLNRLERRGYIDRWLSNASALAADLGSKIKLNSRTSVDHQSGWLKTWNAHKGNFRVS